MTGIGHAVQDGHDRVDHPALAVGRPHVAPVRLAVDQVLDDADGPGGGLAPAIGLVADHLVGIPPLGEPDDPHRHAGLGLLHLADQLLELADAERAGALARGIDVVREADVQLVVLLVAEQHRDLARRQRRPERGDDVREPRLVGHQRVGVALDDDRVTGPADRRLGPVDEVERAALVEQRRGRAS